MTDWEGVRQELEEAGYSGFEFDSGDTAVPGLSGEWVSGNIPREGGLKHENQSLLIRVLDGLPRGGAVDAAPENAPESIRNIATQHGLEVIIIGVSADEARIALCESSERSASA
ncbi:hypothetical protein [Halolamina sediminis]|jgi:hypothetical protein|uniref:hypothetical protein n=1 Tax=Halolamina sediminis TaxID=1480675 RepID=UPI0009AD2864|nr:hypothetical protein [Halolamina sediminis]